MIEKKKTTARRSAINQEDLKPYWDKKGHISLGDQQSYCLQVLQTLQTTKRRKVTGLQFLAVDLSPTFLNTGRTDETFQQSGFQFSFFLFNLW